MKRTELKRNTRLSRGRAVPGAGSLRLVNRKRKAKRFLRNYGTLERVLWFADQPCACAGKHPACSGGVSQNSHTVSKAHAGKDENIIPQSPGCHGFIGTQGWARWEREVGELLGLEGPLDRHALAADFATRGPDAPRGEA